MKIIQVYRGKYLLDQIDYHQRGSNTLNLHSEFASMALSFLQLKTLYRAIDFFTDIEGAKLLERYLKIDPLNINLLPQEYNGCKYENYKIMDQLLACSAQKEPFMFIGSNIILKNSIESAFVGLPIVIHSLNTNASYSYYHHINIEKKVFNYSRSNAHHWDQELTFCFNLSICGGTDPGFWQSYHEYVSAFICDNKNVLELSEDDFNFLCSSYLFKKYLYQTGQTYTTLIEDNFRTPNLKSTNELYRLYHNQKMIKLPRRITDHPETFKYLMENLRDHFPDYFSTIFDFFKFKISNLEGLPFKMTIEVYKRFFQTEAENSNWATLNISEHNIELLRQNTSDSHSRKRLLEDVFTFERIKHRLCTVIKEDYYKANSSLSSYRKPGKWLIDEYLCVSSFVAVAETAWDWRVGLKGNNLHRLKVFYNSTVDPGAFATLFVFNEISNSIQEIALDELTHIVLNAFSEPCPVRQIIQDILQMFDEEEVTNNRTQIENMILFKLYILYHAKALIQTVKSPQYEKSINH